MRDDAGVLTRPLQHVRRLGRAASCRSGRECLYEQCSLHSALTIPSSVNVGSRPSICDEPLVLVGRESVLGDERRRDRRIAGAGGRRCAHFGGLGGWLVLVDDCRRAGGS